MGPDRLNDTIIDVIILNWNGEKVIGPCLESLERVKDTPLRITVVDNASTDSSVRIIRERFPDVELIINDRNLLFARGNNVGLKHAIENGGNLFLLLNNDTEVDPGCFSRMLDAVGQPGVGIVGPKIFFYDDPERIWYGGGGFLPGIWIPRHRNIRKTDSELEDLGQVTEWVTGCALLVKKEVIDDIGVLDPSYIIYCEDVDFCLRAVKAGWKCFYEPSAKVWHKVSSSSGGGLTSFKLENRMVSTSRLFVRHRSVCWRILMFPAHQALYLFLLAGLLISGKWSLARGCLRAAGRIISGNGSQETDI